MKVSVMAAVAMACIGLQGCAATGGTQPGSSWHATGANTAISSTPARNQPVVNAATKESFEAAVAAIRKQMAPGGRWQFVNKDERATIDGSFADMGKLYDQFGSVDKMDQDGKVRLLADQSTVNAILTKKDGDRLICQSEIPVGSHLPVKTCRTYAQVRAEEQTAQQSILKLRQRQNYQLRTEQHPTAAGNKPGTGH